MFGVHADAVLGHELLDIAYELLVERGRGSNGE
jgi:hypothetical protein